MSQIFSLALRSYHNQSMLFNQDKKTKKLHIPLEHKDINSVS